MAPRADLRITAVHQQGETVLDFRSPGSTLRFSLPLTQTKEGQLNQWRKELPGRLGHFQNFIGEDVGAAVKKLHDISRDFMIALAGVDRCTDLQDFLRDAIPHSLQGKPPRIRLIVDDKDKRLFNLKLEYLLIHDPPSGPLSTPVALQEALTCYAGFATVVIRQLSDSSEDSLLRVHGGTGKLPVKIIRNEELYSRYDYKDLSEVNWLARQRSRCLVEELWPDDLCTREDATKLLASYLCDPHRDLRGFARDFADQIQHISCHYRHAPPPVLTLRGQKDAATSKISIELRDLLRDAAFTRRRNNAQPGPFMFLNACASGYPADEGFGSLIELILSLGRARAVLASETEVHFPYAADFARKVYKQLFDGRPLGEAVYRARWELVRSDSSPFGMLYTLYGDPDLHLANGARVTGSSAHRARRS